MATSLPVNVFDPAIFAAGIPHEAFQRLRDEAAVAWQDEHPVGDWPAGPGYWAVTRYVDVRHVLASPGDFSSSAGATQIRDPEAADLPFIRRMILNMDPPEHLRLRRLVTGAFSAAAWSSSSRRWPRALGARWRPSRRKAAAT